MVLDIAPQFKLDAQGQIGQSLQEDAGAVIERITSEFYQSRCGRVVTAAANMVITAENAPFGITSHKAFTDAGAVACAAFMESDVPEELINPVFARFAIGLVPYPAVADTRQERYRKIDSMAREAHQAHPEFKAHTSVIIEYFTAITQQARAGKSAFVGAGYVISQLSAAWAKVREGALDKRWAQAVEGVDWDKFQA